METGPILGIMCIAVAGRRMAAHMVSGPRLSHWCWPWRARAPPHVHSPEADHQLRPWEPADSCGASLVHPPPMAMSLDHLLDVADAGMQVRPVAGACLLLGHVGDTCVHCTASLWEWAVAGDRRGLLLGTGGGQRQSITASCHVSIALVALALEKWWQTPRVSSQVRTLCLPLPLATAAAPAGSRHIREQQANIMHVRMHVRLDRARRTKGCGMESCISSQEEMPQLARKAAQRTL